MRPTNTGDRVALQEQEHVSLWRRTGGPTSFRTAYETDTRQMTFAGAGFGPRRLGLGNYGFEVGSGYFGHGRIAAPCRAFWQEAHDDSDALDAGGNFNAKPFAIEPLPTEISDVFAPPAIWRRCSRYG